MALDIFQTIQNMVGKGLKVGSAAPDFSLIDQEGQTHTLSALKGRWVVLYFYPKDHTFGCTKEACSFQDALPGFKNRNVAVLGVSTDTEESHKAFAADHSLGFPLLSDHQKTVSKDYGVLLPMGVANRVTFLIDPNGIIADSLSWVNWFRYGQNVQARLDELMKRG